jgi:hypothetical protein
MRKGAFMRALKFPRPMLYLLAASLAAIAQPAVAGRTVVDGGLIMPVNGYCTPDGGADCAPQSLPFGITVGGTTYNSFILNGNGTLTLGDTAIDWNSVANSPASLTGYMMPIFSPQIDNTITSFNNDFDPSGPDFQETRWAASVTSTPGSLTAYWFTCTSAVFCGTKSLSADSYCCGLTIEEVLERQTWNMFGLTLTDLGSGFQLDYFYYPAFTFSPPDFVPNPVTPTGTYGYNLSSTGSLQATGSLVNRSWVFGQAGAVPEPGTWMTMLFGFGLVGFTLRRKRPPLPQSR